MIDTAIHRITRDIVKDIIYAVLLDYETRYRKINEMGVGILVDWHDSGVTHHGEKFVESILDVFEEYYLK